MRPRRTSRHSSSTWCRAPSGSPTSAPATSPSASPHWRRSAAGCRAPNRRRREMKIHDVAQRSPEWHALRLGKPTASEFHKIITPKTGKLSAQARKFACRLIAERLLNEPLDLLGGIEAIERGKAMEPDAVAQYEFAEEVETQPVGFVTTDDGLVGASPDRLIVGASAGLEIKCPLLPTHIGYWLDGPGDGYRPQVQGQLWVAEFEWLDFYSYYPQMEPVRLRTH